MLSNLNSNKKLVIILVALSIAVGFVYGLPHIICTSYLAEQGLDYKPYSLISFFDETQVHGPQLKEVLEGNRIFSDIAVYEYKTGYAPGFWPILSPLLYLPISIFTKSVAQIFIFSDFIFPAITFLIIFFIFFVITNRCFISIFFALVFSLFTKLGFFLPPLSWPSLSHILNGFLPLEIGWLQGNDFFADRASFVPNFVPFGLAFLFALLALKKNKLIYPILAGLFFGCLFYTYPFHLIYFALGMGIAFLFFLFQKDYPLVKKIIAIFSIAGLTSIFYWFNYLKFWTLPHAYDLFERMGPEITHSFRWSHYPEYLIYIFLAVLIWFWGKKKNQRITATCIIGFLLAGIAVYNIQIVTGFNPIPDHWPFIIIFGLNLAWLILAGCFLEFLWSKGRVLKTLIMIALVFSSFGLISRNIHYQFLTNNEDTCNARTIPANLINSFAWLEKNTPRDSVIMTPSLVTNFFIPFYTSNKNFLPLSCNTLAPEEEILDRLYITYRIFNVPADYLERLIDIKSNETVWQDKNLIGRDVFERWGLHFLFCAKYYDLSLDGYFREQKFLLPEQKQKEIVDEYKNYDFDLSNVLSKYRLDYIYYGPQEEKIRENDFNGLKYLEKIYEKEGVTIYKFHPELF
jgi:hypothetical protein